MTCAERRLQYDPMEQERLNDELARKSGFKKCPSCAIWIEKTDGCNHMACKCGAHVCWVCMGVFNATSVYPHMHTAHGGINDADRNGNIEGPRFGPADLAQQEEALRLIALRRDRERLEHHRGPLMGQQQRGQQQPTQHGIRPTQQQRRHEADEARRLLYQRAREDIRRELRR